MGRRARRRRRDRARPHRGARRSRGRDRRGDRGRAARLPSVWRRRAARGGGTPGRCRWPRCRRRPRRPHRPPCPPPAPRPRRSRRRLPPSRRRSRPPTSRTGTPTPWPPSGSTPHSWRGFASGEELRRIRDEIASLGESGVALRVVVEHDLLVVVTSPASAVVVDRITNRSFYVDAVRQAAAAGRGGRRGPPRHRVHGEAGERWIATGSQRENPR